MQAVLDTRAAEPHKYEYLVDTAGDSAPAHVVRMVGRSKRVLDLGCGPGSITRVLTRDYNCHVTAADFDVTAVERVKQYCDHALQLDLSSPDWVTSFRDKPKFDVLVAADVLEHLYDPWSTLAKATDLISEDGYLVISLPHVGHASIAACLFDGDFEYREWGLLDRTHIRFFGLKNMEDLLGSAGLKIVDFQYVLRIPEETEFASRWKALPAYRKRALESARHAAVYQVVFKAVPHNRPGDPLRLDDQANLPPTASSLRIRKKIGKYKRKIAKLRGRLQSR